MNPKILSTMNPTNITSRAARLALSALEAAAFLALSGCYYGGDGYYGGPHGAYGVSGGVYGGGHSHHHQGQHSYAKLKPKEKAHLGYGPHAGHPHGGPPGQLKKRGYYY